MLIDRIARRAPFIHAAGEKKDVRKPKLIQFFYQVLGLFAFRPAAVDDHQLIFLDILQFGVLLGGLMVEPFGVFDMRHFVENFLAGIDEKGGFRFKQRVGFVDRELFALFRILRFHPQIGLHHGRLPDQVQSFRAEMIERHSAKKTSGADNTALEK